jgi:hypothetical protein
VIRRSPWRAALAATLAATLGALGGCRPRHRPPAEPAVIAVDAASTADAPAGDAPLPRPLAALTAAAGELRLVPNNRAVPAGGVRSDPNDRGISAGRSLGCGDRLTTGPGGRATLGLGAGAARLDGATAVEVTGSEEARLVIVRGVVRLEAPLAAGEALRVDTPAARVIVAAGEAVVAVAADGAVRVAAGSGAVTVWPATASAGSGVAAGAAAAWSVAGERLPRGGRQPVDASFARAWIARREPQTARARGEALAALTRAVAADEAAEAAAEARLRDGLSGAERDVWAGALALARGRRHARVRSAQRLDGAALRGFVARCDGL